MWHPKSWMSRWWPSVGLLLTLLLTPLLTLLLMTAATLMMKGSRVPDDVAVSPILKPESSPLPKFKVHDCFHRDGLREPWEGALPDGIIEMKGYEHYLVMFREEAERRGGGGKWTQPIEISAFDERHHHVACPDTWLTHNQRGNK